MSANPALGGPLAKDTRPWHKHPTRKFRKECADPRPCSVCGRMMEGFDHHKVPKLYFKRPGAPRAYYDYADLPHGRVYKDAYANRTSLCQDCHEAWHDAFGAAPVEDSDKARKARLRGIRKWGKHVDSHRHRRRRHDTIMHDTVPQAWIDEWADEQWRKAERSAG